MKRYDKIANGIESVVDLMVSGKSFESAFNEFCENSRIPFYYKAQVGYGTLEYLGLDMDEYLRSIPFQQLLIWKSRSDKIEEITPIPSNKEMGRILSRKTTTESSLWEKQGHVHSNDKTALIDRIYQVHNLLVEKQ